MTEHQIGTKYRLLQCPRQLLGDFLFATLIVFFSYSPTESEIEERGLIGINNRTLNLKESEKDTNCGNLLCNFSHLHWNAIHGVRLTENHLLGRVIG